MIHRTKFNRLEGIVEELLQLKIADDNHIDGIENFREHDWINYLHFTDWYRISETLSNEQLTLLLKILTLVERKLNWCGGSVSSTVWLFKALLKRELPNTNEIADWIFGNTSNSWLINEIDKVRPRPIEYLNENRRQRLEEFTMLCSIVEGKNRNCIEPRETGEEKLRKQLEKQKTQSIERNEYISKLRTMNYRDRYKVFASDCEHNIMFYPYDLFDYDKTVLESLDNDLVEALKRKLSKIKKGPWRKLYLRLIGTSLD